MGVLKFVILLGALGRLANGIPLENPSENFEAFFPRIVGGVDADHSPHTAALVIGGFFKTLMCGGSIITDEWILTAAHCIAPLINWNGEIMDSCYITVGTTQWNKGGIVAHISKYDIHKEYDPWMIKNDIGLLKLESPLEFNELVSNIPLQFSETGGGVLCSVAGWGTIEFGGIVPDYLQYLEVMTMTPSECDAEMYKATSGWGIPPINHTIEICARFFIGNVKGNDKGTDKGMCHGDSGSAMVDKKKKKQVGIVSWGRPCATGAPDVFTLLAAFKEYIINVLSSL